MQGPKEANYYWTLGNRSTEVGDKNVRIDLKSLNKSDQFPEKVVI